MSEEEKTIENLRKNKGVSFAEADIILNLIEKQQKEIDKLQVALMTATLKIEGLKIEAVYNNDYISKDKIRDKQIEREFELQQEYKDFEDDIQWKTYKELLEEN